MVRAIGGGVRQARFLGSVVLASAFLVFSVCSVIAGAKGNFYGWVRAEVVEDASCPVAPKRVGVQDSNSQSMAGQIFTGPNVGEGAGYRGDVRYDFQFRANADGIVALEVSWEALNAFDELLGERRISIAFKKPLRAGQSKSEAEPGQRIAEGAAKYRVRVTRVAFADGRTWTAEETTP